MKIRNGFVSNSSGSSFVIYKDKITAFQLDLIKRHAELAPIFFPFTYSTEMFSQGSGWSISEDALMVHGYTSMDNFSMDWYFDKIGVPQTAVAWRAD